MLRKNILFQIIVFTLYFASWGPLSAHSDLYYDIVIREVNVTKDNIIIKGSLLFDEKYSGTSVSPIFYIMGIQGQPYLGIGIEEIPDVKVEKSSGIMKISFVFDLKKSLGAYLSGKDVKNLKSYLTKPKKGLERIYNDIRGGQLFPFVELIHGESGVISIYLLTHYPSQNKVPRQGVDERERSTREK